jgi:hypothetical protein
MENGVLTDAVSKVRVGFPSVKMMKLESRIKHVEGLIDGKTEEARNPKKAAGIGSGKKSDLAYAIEKPCHLRSLCWKRPSSSQCNMAMMIEFCLWLRKLLPAEHHRDFSTKSVLSLRACCECCPMCLPWLI